MAPPESEERLLERLARSEASFRALVEQSPDALFVHGPSVDDFEILYVNPAMVQLLGYADAGELVGRRSIDAFVHPDDRHVVLDLRRRRSVGEKLPPTQVRWVRRDGQVLHVRAVSRAVCFEDREATLVYGQDETEHIRVEAARMQSAAALRASEERYRALFDACPLPAFILDGQTLQLVDVNDAMVRAYGYTREELIGMPIQRLKVPNDVPELVHGIATTPVDSVVRVGIRKHIRKDGQIMEMDLTVHILELDGRRATLGIANDVTQARRLEDQLRQAQKMEAIGQLAGGVAHDFNNILGVILANVELAIAGLDEQQPFQELREIECAAQRAASLTRQLLAFSRKQPREVKRVALNSVVTGIEAMLTRAVGENIELSARLTSPLATIEADRSQVEQVLLNLVVNARDAMPDGGQLVIETANALVSGGDATRLGLSAGRYVLLSVRDTGCGMDAATREHMFEPFFTTKEVGKGTGLGLATVFGIVQQSGGAIDVESNPGWGTTFRIYFPTSVPGDAEANVVPLAPMLHGSETVLLVEDNDQLRAVIRRQLTSWGYALLEAPNGEVALALLADHKGAIDVLLTDLAMPGLDGCALSELVLALRPRMKVVFMSGHTDPATLARSRLDRTAHFMQKPFTARDLNDTMRRALAG